MRPQGACIEAEDSPGPGSPAAYSRLEVLEPERPSALAEAEQIDASSAELSEESEPELLPEPQFQPPSSLSSSATPSSSSTLERGPEEELLQHLQSLTEVEEHFGPDDPQVAAQLRRIALCLARNGRAQQAVPLWIRVLEIERILLGSQHPDVKVLESLVRKQLESSAFGEDAAEAWGSRLLPPEAAETKEPVSQQEETSRLAATAASIGGAAAAGVGGALVSGALHLSFAAATSTLSLVSGAASHAAGFAAQHATAAIVGATPAPKPVVALVASAAGLASSSTVAAARVAADGALGAAHHVGATLVTSAATPAMAFAGRQAATGAVYAAAGVWELLKRNAPVGGVSWSDSGDVNSEPSTPNLTPACQQMDSAR